MQVFKEILYKEVLDQCHIELDHAKKFNDWQSSKKEWDQTLIENITGECLFSKTSNNLNELIRQTIVFKIPSLRFYNFGINFCLWGIGSGIQPHPDEKYSFGATIYLNHYWEESYGGIFYYKHNNQYLKIIPSYNTMVLNSEKTMHYVTPITEVTKESRITLQIWGLND